MCLNFFQFLLHLNRRELLSILKDSPCKNQSINDDIFERRFAKQCCGKHQQGVEPTSGDKRQHKTQDQYQNKGLEFPFRKGVLHVKAIFFYPFVFNKIKLTINSGYTSLYNFTSYHPLVWSMPSAMKSAGKVSSNSFRFSKGQWTWA